VVQFDEKAAIDDLVRAIKNGADLDPKPTGFDRTKGVVSAYGREAGQ
jgi:hypothetical protein